MRRSILAIAALSALLVAGCHPEDSKQASAAETVSVKATPSGYQAKVVSAKELKAHQDQAALVIVDVRPAESYAREHIAGAINIPWAQLAKGHAQLPKDRFIALYCT